MNTLLHFEWIYNIGTVAFTVAGYLVGVRKRLDLLGIVIVALLTAIGGGIIRDVLLSRTPRVFIDATPIFLIIAALLASLLLKLHTRNTGMLNRLFIVADPSGWLRSAWRGRKSA